MWSRLRGNWRPVLLAVGLHLVLAGLLVLGIRVGGIVPAGAGPKEIVEAVVVYPDRMRAQPAPPPDADSDALRRELEAERRAMEENLARERAEAERQAREQAQRERQAREREQAAAQAEAERKAQAEARAKAQAEREARERAEAEARRQAEEQARREAAEEEARRRAAAEEAARQAEMEEARRRAIRDEIEAESRARAAAALAEAKSRYARTIKEHVEARWLRPPGAGEIECDVRVRQSEQGWVIGIELLDSCGSEAAGRSVESAIRKSEPLPLPESDDVFEPEIIFTFAPQESRS